VGKDVHIFGAVEHVARVHHVQRLVDEQFEAVAVEFDRDADAERVGRVDDGVVVRQPRERRRGRCARRRVRS
jgi:hypothetical protein